MGSIPGLGRSPREGNGYPRQYSCLKNPMDRAAWWAPVHGVTKSLTQQSEEARAALKQSNKEMNTEDVFSVSPGFILVGVMDE